MSYFDEPEDDGAEHFLEAGWWNPDDVDELRALMKHFNYPDPFPVPGDRNHAILLMIDHKLNPPAATAVEDPTITWAKILLKDVI